VTKDGGKTWTNVIANVSGVPKRTWVSGVEAGHFDENVAYATFDGHRRGDMKTYIYKTTDGGKTWAPLATADVSGFAQVVREDLVNPSLLFAGTENGLFVSIDGGTSWAQFRENLPPVAVDDMTIHRRDGDLILATHGRGIWIIDDLSPLRSLTTEAIQKDVVMLTSKPAQLVIETGEQRFDGDTDYQAGGVAETASISYYLRKRHIVGESRVEVYDAKEKLVATLPAGKRKGINRVDMPLRGPGPRMPGGNSIVTSLGSLFGPRMPAGKYTVKLIKGNDTFTSAVELIPDARANYPAEERELQQKTARHLFDLTENFAFLTERVMNVRDQAQGRAAKLTGADRKAVSDLAEKSDALYKTLVATREGGWLSGEEEIRERLAMLYGAVNMYDGRPTDPELHEGELLEKEIGKKSSEWDAIAAKELAAANKALAAKKLDPIKVITREEWNKKAGATGTTAAATWWLTKGAAVTMDEDED
jgi:hypothetical protein